MTPYLLRQLLGGKYICPVTYPNEFNVLKDEKEREKVDAWLRALNMRLARLGEEGAFFMAPAFIGPEETKKIRTEMKRFRDEYGPAVRLLEFIRQTDIDHRMLSPGEIIILHELERIISGSTTLIIQFKSLYPIINGASLQKSIHENLRQLLEHLEKDGYVVLRSKDTGRYQVTGKIEQLYIVLQFLNENKVIDDTEIHDMEEDVKKQEDLIDLIDRLEENEGAA